VISDEAVVATVLLSIWDRLEESDGDPVTEELTESLSVTSGLSERTGDTDNLAEILPCGVSEPHKVTEELGDLLVVTEELTELLGVSETLAWMLGVSESLGELLVETEGLIELSRVVEPVLDGDHLPVFEGGLLCETDTVSVLLPIIVTLVELDSDEVLVPVVLTLGVLEFVVLAVNVTELVEVFEFVVVALDEPETVAVLESVVVAVVVAEIFPVFVVHMVNDWIGVRLDTVETETDELGVSETVGEPVDVGSAEGERLGVCDGLPVTETDPVSEKVLVRADEGVGVRVRVCFADRV